MSNHIRIKRYFTTGPPDFMENNLRFDNYPVLQQRIREASEDLPEAASSEIPYRAVKKKKSSAAPKPIERRKSLVDHALSNWIRSIEREASEECESPIPYRLSTNEISPFKLNTHKSKVPPPISQKIEKKSSCDSSFDDENAILKLTYTPLQIMSVRKDDCSWIKPLEVVRAWKRYKIVDNLVESQNNSRFWCNEGFKNNCHVNRDQGFNLEIKRKVIKTLNKVCENNCDRLTKKMIDLSSNHSGNLALIAECILSKACNEHMYIRLYAKICLKIDEQLEKYQLKSEAFLKLLFEIIEVKFRNRMRIQDASKRKKFNKGLFLFVNELFNANKVKVDDIVLYLETLFCYDFQTSKKTGSATEEDLELGIHFITNVGLKLSEVNSTFLNSVFEYMFYLKTSFGLSKRIGFFISNLIDLRRSNWKNK